MGKIRYLIYGSIIVGMFAIIHLVFPPEWSSWIRKTNEMFAGIRPQFIGLFILGAVFYVTFTILFGINFFAAFGKIKYPQGSEHFTPPVSILMPAINEEEVIGKTLDSFFPLD